MNLKLGGLSLATHSDIHPDESAAGERRDERGEVRGRDRQELLA